MDRVLLLETSSRRGQVALGCDGQIVAETRLEAATRRASDLAIVVGHMLTNAGWQPADLTTVVVGLGPGSFTGLRVGLASAKALAYALGCSFVGVDTFAAIAQRVLDRVPLAGTIVVLADALQGNVFVRHYQRTATGLEPTTTFAVQPLNECLVDIPTGATLTGPGAHFVGESARWSVRPEEEREATPASLWQTARLAWATTTDVWQAEPFYLRGSSAEEKRQRETRNDALVRGPDGEDGVRRQGS